MARATKAEQQEAISRLRATLNEGDTVYTILRHVTREGGTRYIDIYIIRDNIPLRQTHSIAAATGHTYDDRHEAIACDTEHDVVYALAYALFGDGNALNLERL